MKLIVFSFLLVLQIASHVRDVSAFSVGAPTAACGDLTQQHPGVTPLTCGPSCPFTVSLVAIDGSTPTSPNTYRCGSQHTFRIETSGPAYRGFAIQARESTPSFSSAAAFVGQFVNPPTNLARIWSCDAPSATHTDNSDKTSIDVIWQPLGDETSDVTIWFSITQVFTTVFAQIRGPVLSPDPSFCSTGENDVVVQFDSAVYGPITEGAQQSITFRLVAQPPPVAGDITVLFSTVSQSATASEDFIPRVSLPVTFGTGDSERFVEVALINDNVYETTEYFMAVLGLPAGSSGVQLGQQSQANAMIFDDDEVTISFNPTSYTVSEGELVDLNIELAGEAQVNVTVAVMFQTRSVTAIAGQDFVPLTTAVGFNSGASINSESVSVLTSIDGLNEGDETFEGVLSLVPGSERINLGQDVATIVIRNGAPPPPQNICQKYYARTEL